MDEVAPGSEVEKAGLQPGDLLRGWERPPSANPQAASGVLASPFDWMWLEVEQVHRGSVILKGERDGKPLEAWHVAAGEWNVHFNSEPRGRSRVRPLLSSTSAAAYQQGQRSLREGRRDAGLSRWQSLA